MDNTNRLEIERELYTALVSKVLAERLVKAGLYEAEAAQMFIRDVDEELIEFFLKMCDYNDQTCVERYFNALLMEAKREVSSRWKSVT